MAGIHFSHALLSYWPAWAAALLTAYLIKMYYNRGLNRYPGPLIANFTNAWRVRDMLGRQHHQTLRKLHSIYGSVLRLGPNTIYLSDLEMIPKIYGLQSNFPKAAIYDSFRSINKGELITSIFAQRDKHIHTAQKRPVAGMYALSNLTSYEPLVDDMIRLFIERVGTEFADTEKSCDMATWLHYMAMDLILHLTFGNTMGFLKQGEDVDGFLAAQMENLESAALCCQMPWIRKLTRESPLYSLLKKDNNISATFVAKQLQAHQATLAAAGEHTSSFPDEKTSEDGNGVGDYGDDFLTRLLRHPKIDMAGAVRMSMTNVVAGSDTTAITLRSIIYYLLKNPMSLNKLQAEIDAQSPPLSYPVTWKESQRLPYLDAVVHEALRLHPPLGAGLERTVPDVGLELPDGSILPGGTTVGMLGWTVNLNEKVFGADAADFVPERWLKREHEAETAFEARLAAMKRSDLAFGYQHSSRVCLGKNISYLEIYKLIPTLFGQFEVGLVEPEKEWVVRDVVFVHQNGWDCWVKRRTVKAET